MHHVSWLSGGGWGLGGGVDDRVLWQLEDGVREREAVGLQRVRLWCTALVESLQTSLFRDEQTLESTFLACLRSV